ncbi:MAG TPA: pyridoxal-phosphate dependent enzyme [Candidatus Cybelea sp.]|nr:pyridoxal-phosphate dependent enzyme [Candidatus Cybelea sp.]
MAGLAGTRAGCRSVSPAVVPLLFDGADEVVYASAAVGGAQTALATVAAQLSKRETIFVAKRAQPHPRALMAKRLGAKIMQVSPGYLNTVQARARDYSRQVGARLAPFGVDTPEAKEAIAGAARSLDIEPDEVWCASGSGVLARGLATAWPNARRHVVQVGSDDVFKRSSLCSASRAFDSYEDRAIGYMEKNGEGKLANQSC